MKINDMSADMIRACQRKCPIALPGGKSPRYVPAESGDWFACAASREEVRRYRKAAKKDLFDRKIRGGSYDGDVGHVVIGGKKFSLYERSNMLVRDDFSQWAEKHFNECWDQLRNCERLPEEPQGEDIQIREDLKVWKDIRKRAIEMHEPTGMFHNESYNSIYDMKSTLAEYAIEIRNDERIGQFMIGTKIFADHLAAIIAYREKNYKDAMDFFLSCAASNLKAALFVQKLYGKKEVSK